ncbi:Putative DNA-binding protein in cluster with Type I restriction-modification system [[Actinomadura] parvosata subsp. kistnae]|uniref:Transcriptional regulator n=2 Tax=Nonomuraea TaxID=83681 RepID=A0A1V0AB41_9ACTN|nr:helix-turn-helix transcriptional regulator [Nonomuraea sp. ATCC 55076]AQZ67393.1 transcriptional regulator [Nonomuraea sp. ATCC 55076]NJP95940.1 helix-turn-helix domain-containing protein [Nonomuraea sp. FMUSA5-5]SPL94365.1 Putative DNA-binding protein in cluster with Type I restriction-modification system [Actinomadura parvosata subsp. kistnae]
MPSQQGSPTVRRLRLGQELRLLRERRKFTGAKAARELGWSPSKVSRIEAAKTMPSAEDIKSMAKLYRADGDKLEELVGLLRDAEQRGWWEDYEDTLPEEYTRFLGLEAEAIHQRDWEPQVVPGLLQTEGYAREVILATRGISRLTHSGVRSRVEARLDRQQRVLHRPDPCRMSVILDEAALMRRFGEPSVMREQMEHLLEVSLLSHVSVQVLPLDSLHPVNTGAFIHLKFAEFDDVVYLEQLYSARFVEDLERVAGYETAFDHMRSEALDEDDSRILIQRKAMLWRR